MAPKTEPTKDAEERLLKAKSDALRLLSVRPRSTQELRDRLKMKKYPADTVDEVIESFKRQGLLNDEQFARLFANSRVYSRPSGKRQLEFDLKKKGLSKELVSSTINNLEDYDEKKMARDLVYGKFQKMKGLDRKKIKSRLFGFLQRRGFNTEVIFGVLNELFKEDEMTERQ